MKTNRFRPLPAAVIADQQAMTAASPLPPATGSAQVSIDAFQVAYKYTARFSYATGKRIVFVSQLLRALVTANGATNTRTWPTIGDLKTNDPVPSSAAAQQSAKTRIAAQPDAANWEIIVSISHPSPTSTGGEDRAASRDTTIADPLTCPSSAAGYGPQMPATVSRLEQNQPVTFLTPPTPVTVGRLHGWVLTGDGTDVRAEFEDGNARTYPAVRVGNLAEDEVGLAGR